ncbi:MAG: DNA replication/repair protein RecF [Sphingomonadaceae bacterium]
MALTRITLGNFRNHAATTLDDTGIFNLLVGENGAGKTNILEALSLFSPGRGLRRASLAEISAAGGPGGFEIGASLVQDKGSDPVRLASWTDPSSPTRRKIRVNGADSSANALGEWLAITWLTPAMDRIFTDSASARRRYLDRLVVAISPSHARNVSRYDASLRERNRLLGMDYAPDPVWLDSVETHLARYGNAIATERAQIVHMLADSLSHYPAHPFARPILRYASEEPTEPDALADMFRQGRDRDRKAGRTLQGPHRDDLEVMMSGKLVPAANCSTGEQKAMLIAITLAHAQIASRGRPSLILLDEVAAHLDPLRRAALFERLRTTGGQVWLTGTELSAFNAIGDDLAVWQIAHGKASRTQ